MNWIKYDPNDDNQEMPEMELNDPSTVEVWIRTDNYYRSRYGIGSYDYELASEGGKGWSYYGCTQGFNVTHWAKIEPPQGEIY